MSENMTVCPECGTEFETVDQTKDLPLQALAQECLDCAYSVRVAIINFPDGEYEVVAPARKGDICGYRMADGDAVTTCGSDAMLRVQRVGRTMEGRCVDHIGSHRERAMSLRDEL